MPKLKKIFVESKQKKPNINSLLKKMITYVEDKIDEGDWTIDSLEDGRSGANYLARATNGNIFYIAFIATLLTLVNFRSKFERS